MLELLSDESVLVEAVWDSSGYGISRRASPSGKNVSMWELVFE